MSQVQLGTQRSRRGRPYGIGLRGVACRATQGSELRGATLARHTKPGSAIGCESVEPFVQFRMAGIVGERGRAKQQKDQDNPHHHRRPAPFFQRLRF